MTCWINREAEQELRKWLDRSAGEIPMRPGRFVTAGMLTEFLDSMHVINAGDDEAEAALDSAQEVLRTTANEARAGDCDWEADRAVAAGAGLSIIRARLRAVRASHTPEEIEAAWRAWEFVFDSDAAATWDGPMDTADAIAAVLPPRPEPAAKPKETQG